MRLVIVKSTLQVKDLYTINISFFLRIGSGNPYQCATGYLFQPELVRQEVLVMKQDFNMRLKQILFNSIVSVYYGAIVPCLFAQVRNLLLKCHVVSIEYCGCYIDLPSLLNHILNILEYLTL